MFEALRIAQVSVWLAVTLVAGLRLNGLYAGAIRGTTVARRLRGLSAERAHEVLTAAPPPLRSFGAVATEPDVTEAEMLLRERSLAAERAATAGLAAIRILGLLASALGFVAVAHQISWLGEDHGLLDLDPTRVGRMASERAAIALALALAASGTAVGVGAVVRSRARAVGRDIAAIRDQLERLRGLWTTASAR